MQEPPVTSTTSINGAGVSNPPTNLPDDNPNLEQMFARLGEQVLRAPREFGAMIVNARNERKLLQREVAQQMNKMLGKKSYGRVGAYDQNHLSCWERGKIGFRCSPSLTGRKAWDFCRFFAWDPEQVIADLASVKMPEPLEDSAELVPKELTLLNAVMAALNNLLPDQRSKVEDALLEMVGMKRDIKSLLAAGLSQLGGDERVTKLAHMLHKAVTSAAE